MTFLEFAIVFIIGFVVGVIAASTDKVPPT